MAVPQDQFQNILLFSLLLDIFALFFHLDLYSWWLILIWFNLIISYNYNNIWWQNRWASLSAVTIECWFVSVSFIDISKFQQLLKAQVSKHVNYSDAFKLCFQTREIRLQSHTNCTLFMHAREKAQHSLQTLYDLMQQRLHHD